MTLWDVLAGSPPAFIALLGSFGLLVGSFLNVVIHRLPIMMDREWRSDCANLLQPDVPIPEEAKYNLAVPRSCCPRCAAPIRALDNIPVLSWLALGGKCRHCRAPISPRYPLIEATAGIIGAVVAWHFGFGPQAAFAVVLSWALLALAAIDYDTMLLPDSITLPLLWLGLLANLFSVFAPLTSAVVGAMAGYLFLWSIYWAFKLATGKEGMGYGDFKLLAALGAWQGWPMLPSIILGAAIVGSVVGLALITLGRHTRAKPIPFGPYLAASSWCCLIWGEHFARFLNGAGSL